MMDEENKTEETKDELQKYGILMSYLEYENSSFWNRNNFFMVAHSALLGFFIPKLPNICSATNWDEVIIPFFYCSAGLILSWLWLLQFNESKLWIKHWHSLLRGIEEEAFGKLLVHRKNPKKIGKYGAKKIAKCVLYLFLGLWIFFIVYLIIAICV